METELARQPHCTKIMRLDQPLKSNPGTNIVHSVAVGLFQTVKLKSIVYSSVIVCRPNVQKQSTYVSVIQINHTILSLFHTKVFLA